MTKNNTINPLASAIKPALPNFIRGGTPFSNHLRRFKDDKKEEDDANDDDANDDDGDDAAKSKKGDEKKYSQAEFTAALEKVRTEERKKLRDELDKEKAGTTKLADEQKALKATVDDLQARVEAFKTATDKDGKTVDVDALLEKYSDKMKASADKQASERVAETEKQIAALQQELSQAKAERLRAKLIQQAGGEDALVIELVNGDTRDEIEASIEKAKAAFDKIQSKFSKKKPKSKGDDEDDDDAEDSREDADDEDEEDDSADDTEDDDKAAKRAPKELPEGSGSGKQGGSGRKDTARQLSDVKTLDKRDYATRRKEILATVKQHSTGGAHPFTKRR